MDINKKDIVKHYKGQIYMHIDNVPKVVRGYCRMVVGIDMMNKISYYYSGGFHFYEYV